MADNKGKTLSWVSLRTASTITSAGPYGETKAMATKAGDDKRGVNPKNNAENVESRT